MGQLFFQAASKVGAVGFGARAYDAVGGSLSTQCGEGAFAAALPAGWTQAAAARYIESLDPLPPAARRLRRGTFLWSEASPKAERKWCGYWDALAEFGIKDGTAVHQSLAGGVTARVTLALADDALPPTSRMALELASHALLDRILAMTAPASDSIEAILSGRERDCLSYAAQGLNDREIAEKLNLKDSTVHFYIEKAKRKLKVRTRAQAVAQLMTGGVL